VSARTVALLLTGSSLVGACRAETTDGKAARPGSLPVEVAARVVDVEIPVQDVTRSSEALGVAPTEALNELVRDASFAQQLRMVRPDEADYLRRVALARRLSEDIADQAQKQGEPTQQEVAEFTRRHWWELDRPQTVQAIHAVVVCEECPNRAAARAHAERLHAALADTKDAASFKQAANQVPKGDFDVRVEELDPVAADGRLVRPGGKPDPEYSFGKYHEAFAQAVHQLGEAGSVSDVIESPSGFHVVQVMQRIEGRQLSYDQRAEALRDEILAERGKQGLEQVLAQARQRWPVQVERSADQDTEQLLADR